ncbi:MAG: alkane 1-monooxygenase [Cyclobacteriaceae bacterium]
MSKLKYMNVLIIPILTYISFTSYGAITYLPIGYSFILIPFLELFGKPNTKNLSETEEELRKDNSIYDWQVYLMVPVQCVFVYLFLESVAEPGLAIEDRIGRITSMGLMCGVLGINVAHELGHRTKKYEQFMAKILLLSSLYMHFFIEHNRGHHKNVSTLEDPSSARKNEVLYAFWIRSVVFSYFSAWKIEAERLRKNAFPFLSVHNQMLLFQFIQIGLLAVIVFFFGWEIAGYFVIAAVMGFLLLETVNYIEHYGLSRGKKGETYERVMPKHSWNSNHVIGRLILFELSRHSDHHYIASRKYQILRHIDESPQMPTGYPGMMLLATVPPLWFYVMNRKLRKMEVAELPEAA